MKLPNKIVMGNLGQMVITRRAMHTLDIDSTLEGLRRYIHGDWGDVCQEDKKSNDYAVKHGERVLAEYRDSKGLRYWIITEWDRSVTTILLPEDY